MLGRIIYSSGGNYRVKTKEGIFNCKPIGLFRKDNTELIVGDKVELKLNYKIGQENLNIITKLYDRKNQFIRPKISNIDFIIIVTSLVEPKFNHFYLNKMITFFQIKKIEPILIFTKIDLNKNQRNLDLIKKYEDLNYKIFNFNNSFSKKEQEKILFILKNKFSILTGQSGVGKSTVLNFLNRDLNLKTGEISFALNRGKHTTRHYEAFEIYENSLIVDSPGFSSFKLNLNSNEISKNFINFAKYYKNCQFKNCLHINEKECFVKKTADSFFYNDYLKLIKEVKENRKF